ncbi:MAG TPA: hypothetical protein VFZ69_08905 [Longimicrobiales bacterium]
MESDRNQRLSTAGAAPAAGAARDVGMYGLRVRSAFDLPEWPAPPPGEPQVAIVEDAPAPATFEGEPHTVRTTFEEGVVQLEVRGVARYAAIGGSCIRVAPEPGARPEDVRLYMTGAMFGLILHQRGIFPLHASCVAIGGTGVAFAAPSGSGKSTLVAALLQRGATFVTDDICTMTPVRAGASSVWPGPARMKLDEAGVAALEDAHAPAGLQPAGGNRGKYHVPVGSRPTRQAPIRLSRVYLLGFGEGEPRLERLGGLESISALVDETYMLAYAVALGLSPQIFSRAAELSRTITVSRLIRPRGFEHLDPVLDLIERDVRGATGGGPQEKEAE